MGTIFSYMYENNTPGNGYKKHQRNRDRDYPTTLHPLTLVICDTSTTATQIYAGIHAGSLTRGRRTFSTKPIQVGLILDAEATEIQYRQSGEASIDILVSTDKILTRLLDRGIVDPVLVTFIMYKQGFSANSGNGDRFNLTDLDRIEVLGLLHDELLAAVWVLQDPAAADRSDGERSEMLRTCFLDSVVAPGLVRKEVVEMVRERLGSKIRETPQLSFAESVEGDLARKVELWNDAVELE